MSMIDADNLGMDAESRGVDSGCAYSTGVDSAPDIKAQMPESARTECPKTSERKAGMLAQAMPKAKGAPEPGTNRGATRSHDVTTSTYEELGITKMQAHQARVLEAVGDFQKGRKNGRNFPIKTGRRRRRFNIGPVRNRQMMQMEN